MPIYEYACRACGHEFEVIQRMNERAKRKCPQCSELSLEKLISRTSFVLKGGGWYADGYGGEAKKSEEAAGGKQAEKKEKKADKAADQGSKKKAEPAAAKSEKKPKAKRASSG